MAEALLETEQLSRRFGALAAVDGVSIAFQPLGVHAVIGPNGAGKSTFLNLLSGELRATSGAVRFRGKDVTRSPPNRISRLGIGRTYQTANVFADLTCAECLWLAAHAHGRDSEAAAALGACGLGERAGKVAGDLSYGEQRQLEIGMILATGSELLLLDEPLAGLGHDEAERMVELLRRLAAGHTMVLVEHDMDAVFSIARTITVMVDGRVLETGSAEQIRQSAAVREAYLGSETP
jgi:branched-chain amino acid transport system ATP-binding protein